MVKTTYVFIAVIILILVGGYFESRYVDSKFTYFKDSLEVIIEKTDDSSEEVSDDLQGLIDWWKKEKHVLHAFIPHNEIRDIDGIMVEAKNLINYKDYKLATTRLRKLYDTIEALPHNYSFTLGNIF